jgi:hypothetical protein
MSILYRTLIASLLICALAPRANSNSTANEDVVALRETVIALAGDRDLKSTLDSFALSQVRLVGANDPTWRQDNPNWAPVENLVRDDLNRDVGVVIVAQQRDIADRWDRALSTHLTSGQTHQLVKFYRSELGQRYLGFQKQLKGLQLGGASAVVANLVSGDRKQAPDASSQVEARKRVATLSWVVMIFPALTTGTNQTSNPAATKIVNDMMVDALAKARGRELDELGAEYGKDLPAFAAFQGSPEAKALITVYGVVAQELQSDPTAPQIGFAAALRRSVEQHMPEWKAAYEAGRASAQ